MSSMAELERGRCAPHALMQFQPLQLLTTLTGCWEKSGGAELALEKFRPSDGYSCPRRHETEMAVSGVARLVVEVPGCERSGHCRPLRDDAIKGVKR